MTYLKILSVTNTKWSRIVGSPVNKELGMIWPWSNVVYGAGIHVTIDFWCFHQSLQECWDSTTKQTTTISFHIHTHLFSPTLPSKVGGQLHAPVTLTRKHFSYVVDWRTGGSCRCLDTVIRNTHFFSILIIEDRKFSPQLLRFTPTPPSHRMFSWHFGIPCPYVATRACALHLLPPLLLLDQGNYNNLRSPSGGLGLPGVHE